MSALAAIIGAGVSAAGSILATQQRNEAQKRENELAYQREQARIKEQNAYNSASAQVARLQAAGLNPNMMYENSQEAAAGTQSEVARYQPSDMQNSFEPMGNAGEQIISQLVGLKDIENKTALAESQILVNASTANLNTENAKLSSSQSKRILDLLGWEISEKESLIGKLDSETMQNIENTKRIAEDTKLISEKIGLTINEASKLNAETRYILARLPYASEFAKLEVDEKRAVIGKIAQELVYMDESLRIQNFNKWVNMADVIARNVIQGASVTAKFHGKGASLNDLFGSDPWSMMNGKGAFTKGFNLNDSSNPFGQFLAGD